MAAPSPAPAIAPTATPTRSPLRAPELPPRAPARIRPVHGRELTPTDRALAACDNYGANLRSMRAPEVLDQLLAHPDPKLGVLGRGLRRDDGSFRSYGVVRDGALVERAATYDGSKLYLYVPASETRVLAELERAVAADARYGRIAIVPTTAEALRDPEERLRLKYDRPGVFWVSPDCPLLPHRRELGYIVPGGRFGVELYYHDTRINLPGARSTLEAQLAHGDRDGADATLSLMRGTVNALANQVFAYGKIFNATITPNVGRSQPPCLTSNALETYRAWLRARPEEAAEARVWLRWVADAAAREYETVWTAEPRLDRRSGLSRYVDETPSIAPEEAPHFYAGLRWSTEDVASDAAVREHGWDSMPAAIAGVGPDRGRPRVHHLLPVCLNSLLYRYERDLALIRRELGEAGDAEWDARAERRAATMRRLMWSDEHGLFMDVYHPPGSDAYPHNGHEDLRSFMPLWAGVIEARGPEARALVRRARDFVRPGGLGTATAESWEALRELNAKYVERCQWGHPDIGWPIATYETVRGLQRAGAHALADEIAYRWCHMVQVVMEQHGGPRSGDAGLEAPIAEKMDVTRRSAGHAADVGYGNQGTGAEGAGTGFRWGYDAYKLLARGLSAELRDALRAQRDPDLLFAPELQLVRGGL